MHSSRTLAGWTYGPLVANYAVPRIYGEKHVPRRQLVVSYRLRKEIARTSCTLSAYILMRHVPTSETTLGLRQDRESSAINCRPEELAAK